MTKEITITQLFERLVILETKFDVSVKDNKKVSKTFTKWAIAITALEIINIWVHSLSLFGY